MEQLKMYWLPGTPIENLELPEGYSFSNYKDEKDADAWISCCRNGLVSDNYDEAFNCWKSSILDMADINLYEDVFFLDFNGEHVGTITAFIHSDNCIGYVHMVGIRTDFRGKGLGKYLNNHAVKHLSSKNPKFIRLTTDEWRTSAVKSYLRAGFKPVKYDRGMPERWRKELEAIGIDSVDMYNDKGKFYKTIYRSGLKK